jgi:2-iminobutanoate/2-iminopropanoate deaminase
MRRVIRTEEAPAAIGPYSQAIESGGLLWVSGQIPLDPATGQMVAGGIEEQTRRALTNLRAVVEAGGSSLEQALRVTVYLADMGDFGAFNAIYAEYFPSEPPARVCFEASALPKGAQVEVDAVVAVQARA